LQAANKHLLCAVESPLSGGIASTTEVLKGEGELRKYVSVIGAECDNAEDEAIDKATSATPGG
jgi:hypothetical protein